MGWPRLDLHFFDHWLSWSCKLWASFSAAPRQSVSRVELTLENKVIQIPLIVLFSELSSCSENADDGGSLPLRPLFHNILIEARTLPVLASPEKTHYPSFFMTSRSRFLHAQKFCCRLIDNDSKWGTKDKQCKISLEDVEKYVEKTPL